MPTERWHQVEQLFHAVLERGAEERAAFLAQACAGDERLIRRKRKRCSLDGLLWSKYPKSVAGPFVLVIVSNIV